MKAFSQAYSLILHTICESEFILNVELGEEVPFDVRQKLTH